MQTKIFMGGLLRQLRKENKLTQQEIAELLHMSRQAYNRLECGYVQPTVEIIAILSDIYDYDLFLYILKHMPEEMLAEQTQFKLNLPINSINEATKKTKSKKKKSHKNNSSHKDEENPDK